MQYNALTTALKKYLTLTLPLSAALFSLPHHAFAHGEAAHMVPLYQNMTDFGADVKKDEFTNSYTISKGSLTVRAKPNSDTVLVNGKPLKVSVPLVIKDGQPVVSKEFASEVFQSGLDQTFTVEAAPHPLNGLTTQEISLTFDTIKKSKHAYENMRFSEIKLKEPEKSKVWDAFLNHRAYNEDRVAIFTLLKGKQVIEGAVDLKTKKVTQWNVLENTHGMVLYDDMVAVQEIITASEDYKKALAKRGVHDISKVVTTPLTVGYFGGKDGLDRELNVLKVVSYLDTGDGNYWAHPIENLVAVVDLDNKKIVKLEEGSIIPVPMQPNPIAAKNQKAFKPLEVVEPEGKNFSISGQTIHWGPWCFHVGLDSRVGLQISTATYKDRNTYPEYNFCSFRIIFMRFRNYAIS